jgi:tetratricopeptide (TPR) repeat protein
MVSGDATNVAARLQQAAEPGEILVGPLTEQLTRSAIEYEPHERVGAKGKAEPLVAFRALRARSQTPVQARGVPGLKSPLVGRTRELRLLLDTYDRSAADRRVHLFTIIGSAGVGKSRLVSEALTSLAGSGARVVRGRCLPYGRGITYWPLMEIVRQDTGIAISDERDVAIAKFDRWLGELLAGDQQSQAVRSRMAVMMGFETPATAMPDTPAERVAKEIEWAARHYLDALARGGPLIVVVDDLHSAEPAVTDLVEHIAERSADVPMLIVVIARPEFIDTHPGWGSGTPNSTTITLDPLNPQETSALIAHLLEIDALPAELRAQIIERSAGTPLFCEEFVRMLIDDGHLVRRGDSWTVRGSIESIKVPHSVQAVLAARLDSLPDGEKQVLQAASVIGERFEPHEVRNLMAGSDPETNLDSLRRRGLIVGGDGPEEEIRFKHILVRDASYASLPKSERAALHDRVGLVLEAEAGDPQQVAEILAHHAERAFTLSTELALEGEPITRRAERALEWSLLMGDRAMTRSDRPTVDAALGTAKAATHALPGGGGPAAQARVALLLTQALLMTADYAGAQKAAEDAAIFGEQAGLWDVVAKARLAEAWTVNWGELVSMDVLDAAVARAVEACRKAGDVAGEIEARHIGTNHLYAVGRLVEFIRVNESLVDEARAIKDFARAAAILVRLANSEQLRGNTSIARTHLAEAEQLAAEHGLRNVALQAHLTRGTILMMAADFHAAEAVFRAYAAAAEDAGAFQQQVSALRFLAYTLLFDDRPAGAAEALDRALVTSEVSGERWNRAELFALRARASLDMGDLVAAEAFMERAVELVLPHDVTGNSEVYHHLGVLRSAQQRAAEAEASFRRSLEFVVPTDYEWPQTNAALDLAKVLVARGEFAEAEALMAERETWIRGHDLHLWDRRIAEIRGLLERASRS